jgi:ubiquinone/menaquinone biosynthesis C-methylase UbiE
MKSKTDIQEEYIPALAYDFLTPFYDTVVGWTTRETLFKNALVEQASLKPGQRVLDLACGTGTLTLLLKQRVPGAEVIGIDGDPKILSIANEKARDRDVAIRFDQGMSFDLPYADGAFDRVVSSLFFHHLSEENKRKTLSEIGRVLKKEGELHIADWGRPANLLAKIGSRFIQMLDGSETTAANFEGRLPSIVGDAGFDRVEQVREFNSLFGTIRLLRAVKLT